MNTESVYKSRPVVPTAPLSSHGEDSPSRGLTGRRKTRVLFVIDQLCEAGGAERMLLKTIEGLPKDQFDCWLITFKYDATIEAFQQLPCPTHVFPLGRTYDLNALRVARKIRKIIRSNKIDIVHTFHETSDIWGGLVAKASGCRVLVSSRRDMGILRSRKHTLVYPFVNHFVDKVLAVSERVRNYCIQADGLSPNKVLTLYNGLDLTKVDSERTCQSVRKSFNIPETAPVITTVGHIRKVKGVDIFIRAAARVCQEFPEAVFLVVGDATDKDHFEELVQLSDQLGIRRHIKWLGDRKDIYSILKASDVFCLPSRSEGFSNALVEAMACSLPCVATDVGGNGEAISDGVNGYLIRPEDSELMADRLADLLRFPARARELGDAARGMVEKQFTLDAMIRRLVGIYSELVA